MSARSGREEIRVGLVPPPESTEGRGQLISSPEDPARAEVRLQLRRGVELDRFCAALSAATGLEVSAHELGDYADLLDAMQAGDIDLAWLPPVVALRVTARGKTVPIALPVRGGSAYYSTALFTRPDSHIRKLTDLPGARAAWVDPHSAAGYLVIRASLRQRGIDITRVFGSETFYGSHAAVGKAVLSGEADVGASFVHLDPRRSKPRRAGWGDAQVRMLATAGPIPGDVIAVTARLSPDRIRLVQRALVRPPTEEMRAAATALFGAEEFIVTHKEHLSPIQGLLDLVEDRADAGPSSTRLS